MNKQAVMILSFLAAISANTAFALDLPGWDRPVFRSELTVLNEQGSLPGVLAGAKTVELVMTQQDGAQSPTGFVLLTDGQFKQAYQVKSITQDPCNTTTYTLVPVQEQNNYVLTAVSEGIQLVDHSGRTCLDYRKYRWELEVTKLDLTHEVVGQVQLAGNPESVITPQ